MDLNEGVLDKPEYKRESEANDEIKLKSEPDTEPTKPRFSAKEEAKAAKILDACRWKDIETLRALAASEGGLLSDELRSQACKYPHPLPCNTFPDTTTRAAPVRSYQRRR